MGEIGAILHGVASVRVARGEDFSAGSVATRGEKRNGAASLGAKPVLRAKLGRYAEERTTGAAIVA
jgi:hypothetical protein